MTSSRDSVLLRGASAASAAPWQRVHRPAPEAGTGTPVVPSAVPVTDPVRVRPTEPVEPMTVIPAGTPSGAEPYPGPERRSSDGRPVYGGSRLGDVYAEQLEVLREQARRQGWAAGHAEGIVAAADVVAAAERAAEERLADAQMRWERRLASATAALGAAVQTLDSTAAPVVDEMRDTLLEAVFTLVGDLLGRELATADSPGLDALRRALTLAPTDVPVLVRVHPDDLAQIPRAALAQLPPTVSVVGDEGIERAGAVAEAGRTRVDAQLSAAVQRLRTVLRS
jgi:flagellar assembly protein FliH